jgi:hypothetical protein
MSALTYMALHSVAKRVHELTGILVTRATVYNWVKTGRIGLGATRVKLHTVKRCGRRWTTEEWLNEFLRKVG